MRFGQETVLWLLYSAHKKRPGREDWGVWLLLTKHYQGDCRGGSVHPFPLCKRPSAVCFPSLSFHRKLPSFRESGTGVKHFIQSLTWLCLSETLSISRAINTPKIHSLPQTVLADQWKLLQTSRVFKMDGQTELTEILKCFCEPIYKRGSRIWGNVHKDLDS